jgi:hypothetical protein
VSTGFGNHSGPSAQATGSEGQRSFVKSSHLLGIIWFSPQQALTPIDRRTHQEARLTPRAYTRERGIMETHLQPFFTARKLLIFAA